MWDLIPEAKTTAEKIQRKEEPLNITTLEKKIKDEFDGVSAKIKSTDYRSITSTFKTIQNFFLIIYKSFG